MVLFRFYLERAGDPFWEEKYKRGETPPIPRMGEKVALGDEVYMVVETPTHYFERTHEVALTLKPLHLVDESGEVVDPATPVSQALPPSTGPRTAEGLCAYCGDSECPGGEECNFYDGTLG